MKAFRIRYKVVAVFTFIVWIFYSLYKLEADKTEAEVAKLKAETQVIMMKAITMDLQLQMMFKPSEKKPDA